MDNWLLAVRTTGILLLWLFSAAPVILASTAEAPERQTEFSDRNYQPSRQINTSAPIRSSAPRSSPARERRIIQSGSEKVKWISARGEEQEYRMYYEYDGTNVTFASVCSNYRKGSIDYRNCRKAAKQWFSAGCNHSTSTGRMYCQAANAFRP